MSTKAKFPKEDASHTIEKWLAPLVQRRRAAAAIGKCKVEVEQVQSALDGVAKCGSVGEAQGILMRGDVVKAIEVILRTFARPSYFHMQLTQQARLVVTAVLITHFPEEILMSNTDEEEDGAEPDIYLQEESRKCVDDARVVASCVHSLVTRSLTAPQRLTPYSSSLPIVLKLFSASFDSWRRADKLRTVAKLEDTFMQTYSVYLGALNGRDGDTDRNQSGPSRSELVIATQQQLEKIRQALVQVLGKHAAASKIEEICAAVEAAFYTAATSGSAQPDSAASTPLPSPLPSPLPRAGGSSSTTVPATQPPKPPAVTSSPSASASSPAASETSTPPEISALAPAQQRILDKLAALSGIHQERLAYEIVLNPYYRLPPLANPLTLETFSLPRSSSASSNLSAAGETSPRGQQTLAASVSLQTTASVAETLKTQMLRVLGDKLVNSVRRSTISSPDQIVVGQEVPLYFMANGASVEVHTAGTGSAHFTFTRTPILTARVLAVRRTVVQEVRRTANYYITVLVPVLQQHGHDFLKERFQQRLLRGQVSLDATASLIYSQLTPAENFQATVKDFVEAGVCSSEGDCTLAAIHAATAAASAQAHAHLYSGPSGSNPSAGAGTAAPSHLIGAIVARSLLSLLQLPFRLDTPEAMGVVPETLAWDASRLAAMRDLVDRIALECSLVIACKQVLARYQLPPWCGDSASEVELQHRLDVLLTERDTSMASIAAEVSRYVLEALHKFRQAHLAATTSGTVLLPGVSPRTLSAVPATHPALVGGDSQEVHERVNKALKDVVAEGNPVLQLFSKRVYKVLLRAMLGQGFKHLLPSYSLHSPAQQRNLSQLAQSVCRLYTHTMRIHRDVYTVVIGRAVASASEGAGHSSGSAL